MDDLFAHLVVEEVALALLPGFFVVHECLHELWVVFELGVHHLNVLLVLLAQRHVEVEEEFIADDPLLITDLALDLLTLLQLLLTVDLTVLLTIFSLEGEKIWTIDQIIIF